MLSKSIINIVFNPPKEISSVLTINRITYHIHTETTGRKTYKIISRIYLRGEIVFSKQSDYSHLKKGKGSKDRLSKLIEKQHKATIDLFLDKVLFP